RKTRRWFLQDTALAVRLGPRDSAVPLLAAAPSGRIEIAVQVRRDHAVARKVVVAGRRAGPQTRLNNSGIGAAEILHRAMVGLCSTCRRRRAEQKSRGNTQGEKRAH